jgi:hypothetical protein
MLKYCSVTEFLLTYFSMFVPFNFIVDNFWVFKSLLELKHMKTSKYEVDLNFEI